MDNLKFRCKLSILFISALAVLSGFACTNDNIASVVKRLTVTELYGRTELKAEQATEVRLKKPFLFRKFKKGESHTLSESAYLQMNLSLDDWRFVYEDNHEWQIYQQSCTADCPPLSVKIEMLDENGQNLIAPVTSAKPFVMYAGDGTKTLQEHSLEFGAYDLDKALITPLAEGESRNVSTLKLVSNFDVNFDNIQSRHWIPQ